jgi:hypothetical protein
MNLFEQPLVIIVSGVVLLVIAYFFWTQTRFKWILHLMAVLALLTIGLVIIAQLVHTDKEQVVTTLDEIAAVVEANDVPGAMAYFAQDANTQAIRDRAEAEMPNYHFSRCRISKIKSFKVIEGEGLKKAEITLDVVAEVSAPSLYNSKMNGIREMTLMMQKQPGGEWKLLDYSHRSPVRLKEK